MSMFNDIGWTKKENSNECFPNSLKVRGYAKRFQKGHWSLLGPGDEENGSERTTTSLKDSGIVPQMSWNPISKTADIQFFAHPVRWTADS